MLKRYLNRTLQRAAMLLCLGWSLQACTVWASPAKLADLEEWAQASAPTVRLAQAEKDVASQRAEVTRAREGARFFGNATLGNAREAVTDTVGRSYQRAQLQAGVRWPLLGSREAQLRAIKQADQGTAARQVQLQATQQEAVLAVRRAYLRHLHGEQRVALTQAFLAERTAIEQLLEHRTRAGYMLEAERLGLSGLFSSTETLQRTLQSTAQSSLREISRLTGRPIGTIETVPIAWPETCTRPDVLLAQMDEHPSVLQARMEVDAIDQVAAHARRETVEAGVSLSQAVSKDFGGQPGHSTAVGIDVSIPLGWRAHRDALLGQLQSERFRAESLLELRRGEFRAAAEQAVSALQIRQADLVNSQRLLKVAQENLRVSVLRQRRMEDGDGFARVLTGRYAVLQAGLQWIEAAERLDLAATEVAAWSAAGCPQATTAPASTSDLQPVLRTLLNNPFLSPPRAAPDSGTYRLGTKAVRATEASPGLGWYAWDGQALVEHPQQLRRLPAGTQRVLISFTAPQLAALRQAPVQQRLAELVAHARRRGMKVELLLGEPTWVLSNGREQLVELVRSVRNLPFDALHLDLERSQLPEAQQPLWDDGVLETVRAVRAVSPWPVALTTHYRELEAAGFASRLQEAGASELTAMIYVSDAGRTLEIASALLQGPPGLKLSVAQSIERSLPPEESSFHLGKTKALQRWQALAQALSAVAGFNGVVVQSWEEFKEARP